MELNKLIKPDSLFRLSPQKQIEYVTTHFHLKDNFLIGTVGEQRDGQTFFFINQLINPYTGLRIIERLLVDRYIRYSAYCRGSQEQLNIQAGDTVLFQFNVTKELRTLREGGILTVDPSSIQVLRKPSDVLAELHMTVDDLMADSSDIQFHMEKVGYIVNFYHEIIKEHLLAKQQQLADERDTLNRKEDNIKNEIEKLIIDSEKLKEQRAEQEARLAKDKQKVEKEIEEAQMQLQHKKEAVYNELNDLYKEARTLGFSLTTYKPEQEETKEQNTSTVRELPESEQELITAIQQQIARSGLYYEEDTLRQFYSALKANQFVILSGPSGTGKTSLISAFAKATSSEAKVIPVQPSWTDKQDLLGYYNPLDKQYVPSALLDAMIEAEENKDRLYLICLDELNLAQIEYYFADILSLREQTDIPLELYSKYEYEQNLAEICWFLQRGSELSKQNEQANTALETIIENELHVQTIDQFRYTQRYQNLRRYNWSLHIPENVRFIGTMNIDGTVRPLSPKVVDRSFIIPIELQTYDGKVADEEYCFDLTYAAFSPMPEIDRHNEIKATLKRQLVDDLQALDANFNTRVENHLDAYIAIQQYLSVEEEKIYDELILLKLLPRIEKMIDFDINVTQFLDKVQQLCGEKAASVAKIKAMIEKSEQSKIFSYWS